MFLPAYLICAKWSRIFHYLENSHIMKNTIVFNGKLWQLLKQLFICIWSSSNFFFFWLSHLFSEKVVHIHLFFFLPYPSTLIQKYSKEITEAIYHGWQKNQHCFLKHHKKRMLLSPPKSNGTKIFSLKISEKKMTIAHLKRWFVKF